MDKQKIGIIVGNRDFFPDHLISEARQDVQTLAEELGFSPILLEEKDTKLGGVETYSEAKACGDLFRKHRDEIVGIWVVLPNFGDEKGVADTIRISGLNVPVIIQGYPDKLDQLNVTRRRDAFCGKISVCNNLYQYNIPFTLTSSHVIHPLDQKFKEEFKDFMAVCRIVKGLRGLRLGAIGARPGAFNTVRYSEKILERHGISVMTMDLSEILGHARKLEDGDIKVKRQYDKITTYAPIGNTPEEKLIQMAKLDVVLEDFVQEYHLDATAIQCWTSVQSNFGCNVCTSMSIMSENMMPSACEVDVTGTLSMYALQLASNSPSALVDWNNNYGQEDDKCILFHCGNWAKSFLPDIQISSAPILGTIVGEENTYGALEGRTPAAPLTFGRISTDDNKGIIKAYIGEGHLTDDPLLTFGNRAVAQVPHLQNLIQYVCKNGFEHHVVMNASHTADILKEALENYLGWDVYHHTN